MVITPLDDPNIVLDLLLQIRWFGAGCRIVHSITPQAVNECILTGCLINGLGKALHRIFRPPSLGMGSWESCSLYIWSNGLHGHIWLISFCFVLFQCHLCFHPSFPDVLTVATLKASTIAVYSCSFGKGESRASFYCTTACSLSSINERNLILNIIMSDLV